MSLQYKTQVYIRKAIRQAVFTQSEADLWTAHLPAFGLEATGGDEHEAELNLLMVLTVYVLYRSFTGVALPRIEDIDLNEAAESGLVLTMEQASKAVDPAHEPAAEQRVPGPTQEVVVLTERESAMVAGSLAAPPSPTPYLSDAAREYRELMGY